MAAIKVLQDPHVAQLIDRAASGNLTVTEQAYDCNYAPSILHAHQLQGIVYLQYLDL